MISTQVAANRRLLPCDVSVQRHGWGEPVEWSPELVVDSDVTYDRDAHDRLCASLKALKAPAILAHQHRRVASFLSGESQLDHFLATADHMGLAVDLGSKVGVELPVALKRDAADARVRTACICEESFLAHGMGSERPRTAGRKAQVALEF